MTNQNPPSEVETPAEQAFRIHAHAAQVAEQWRRGSVDLAKLIYAIRTIKIGDKYVWEWCGFDTEQSYFAAPLESGGLDLGWRMVQRYTDTHRDLHEIAGLSPKLTEGIDRDKLDLIRTLIVQDGEVIAGEDEALEILSMAKAQSRSDFRQTVNQRKGISNKHVSSVAATHSLNSPLDLNNEEKVTRGGQRWFDLMDKAKCCIMPWKGGERAHVPVSKGAGGEEWKHCVIPLCRTLHSIQHTEGIQTFLKNKANHQPIFRYLYKCIFVLLAENADLKERPSE